MPLAWKPPRLPKPYSQLQTRRATLRFYLGDCLEVLHSMTPASISVIVTSPPYNLGVRYRTYEDTLPRTQYLAWTGAWVEAAARVLEPEGSLFLNVGAKPTDPWTGLDVAQAARAHLQLQNTIHWIKSIAIDQDAAGTRSGLSKDLNVGHYKPINSERFVNDCHEFIFHFTPRRTHDARSPRHRREISGRLEHHALARRRRQSPLPRQHLVHPVRDDPESRQGSPAPRDVPAARPRVRRPPARPAAHEGPARSLSGSRQLRPRRGVTRDRFCRESRSTSTICPRPFSALDQRCRLVSTDVKTKKDRRPKAPILFDYELLTANC